MIRIDRKHVTARRFPSDEMVREGILGGPYLAEFKDISGEPGKSYPHELRGCWWTSLDIHPSP